MTRRSIRQRAICPTLVIALTVAAVSPADAQAGVTRSVQQTVRSSIARFESGPPKSGGPLLIAGQIVGGSLAAAGAGFLAWGAVVDPYGEDYRVKGDAGYTPNANTAYAIGSFAGAVVATHLIGRMAGSRANIVGTALGAAIPTIPLLFGRDEPYLPLIGVVLVAPAQGIAAMLGDQLSRR